MLSFVLDLEANISRDMGTEIVTLYVANKRKEFVKLLCDGSEYFLKAFISGFKEGIEGVMYLPEDEAESTERIISFLLHSSDREVPVPQSSGHTRSSEIRRAIRYSTHPVVLF
jgi:hypothetical protein